MLTTEAAAKEFVKWAMTIAWEGGDADGSDLQEKAIELGLVVKTVYDPIVHGTNHDDVSPGDEWYELAPGIEDAAP